eukprot:TRINITY_DN30580_c0_g1_i1.p1 TRINITY_DN30580_c0_g1~~TRINITY_DN30580_c0_g1_i1.p1  ORF type:complete len:201 (-),score=27.43 TRINITY_DN30580_c0_g1_i1:133-735(-)
MYIIANIKKCVDAGWKTYVEDIWERNSVEDATELMCNNVLVGRKKLPYQLELKYVLVCAGLHQSHQSSIVASWEAAGITRALYLVTPNRDVFYDTYVEMERLRKLGDTLEDPIDPVQPVVVDPVVDAPRVDVPVAANVILENTPTRAAPPTTTTTPSTEARRVGRPKKVREPPATAPRSVMQLLSTMKKRPREEEDDEVL